MDAVNNSILETIGNTPMVKLTVFDTGPCELFVKLENHNPGGSIKDRIGLSIIEEAEKSGIEEISDLRKHPNLKFGFTNEFMDRKDGWPGLQKFYNLPQTNVNGLDHDLAYRGLASSSIDVIDLYSTDAEINYYDLKVLEDDLHYFTDYQAVLL
mgnify:CR=1 FL=1